jgi:hypothetical protein
MIPQTGAHDVSNFPSPQKNNMLYFFLHELIAFYEQAGQQSHFLTED